MTDATAFAPPSISEPAHWRRSGLLIGLVALVMTSILGWMVWDRVSLLKNGREIVLPVTPVDPRSLFRGDYVILGYDVTTVPAPASTTAIRHRPRRARPSMSSLEQGPDGDWKAISSSRVPSRQPSPATASS